MDNQFEPNNSNNNQPIEFNNAPTQNTPANDPGHGLAIASLVCGIISFLCCGIPCGVAAVICGFLAKNKGNRSGLATAGIVCGIIGAVLAVISIFAMGSFTAIIEEILAQSGY